jgi:protein-tyrosine kinase
MSKMFDSMRRAEGERRKHAERSESPVESAAPPVARESAEPARIRHTTEFSDELLRQLGMLRNAIEVELAGKTKRVILFTSSMPGEGTTTIAANFAKVLALQGNERVLVCEMNARRPAFSEVFSTNGESGITEYFASGNGLAQLVQRTKDDGLGVLHVGHQDATIIQLHLKQVFPRLLAEALKSFDTIIVDAPPVLSSPETPPMAEFVDGVVMVVHSGKTKREAVARAIESIKNFNGKMLGVVLNRKRYYIPGFIYRRI